jgi:hypothetical protein
MSRRTHVLSFLVLFALTSAASGGSGMLDLIPEDAAAAFAIRDLNDLKKKGDQLLDETKLNVPLRPSEIFDLVYKELGLKAGVDPNGSAALVLLSPEVVGAQDSWDRLIDRIVVAVPFTDRDQIAANFGIKAGALKPGQIVPGKGENFGTFFLARENQLYLGNEEKAIAHIAKSDTVGSALTAAQRRTFGDADMLLQLGPKWLGDLWDGLLAGLKLSLESTDESDRQVLPELIDSFKNLRSGLAAVRLDGGLGIHLLGIYPKEGSEEARKFLTSLQAGPGTSTLAGLPAAPVVAAQATGGEGSQNAAIVRLLANFVLKKIGQTKWPLAAADRPNHLGVFTEVWKRLQGSRAAVYVNADEQKHGLFTVVAILDTEDPDKLLKEIRQLARFAAGAVLDMSDKAARKEDVAEVEQLIRDLGDERYLVRESASTKLGLIGEPVLPLLEKAITSTDLEVRRRAEDLKERILAAAAARRKELLSKDLTQHLRPAFSFAPEPELREELRLEVVRVHLAGPDAPAASQLRQLLGPSWDRIRLVVHGKQIVALWGSDLSLLQATLTNLKEGRPGLAEAKCLAPFERARDPGRKFEIHLSVQTGLALIKAEDLKQKPAVREQSLSSFALTAEPERLQLDLWLPSAELRVIIKEQGYGG